MFASARLRSLGRHAAAGRRIIVAHHQHRGGDRGGLDAQHVSGRATPSAPATSSSFGDQPPSGPTAIGRVVGAQRPPTRLGRRRTRAAPRPPATGPAISGNHTRRDCIAASAAMRRSRSSWRSARSLRPAHDRVLGVDQDDAVDADLGALGDEPLEAIALRRRHGDRQRWVRTRLPCDLARRLDAVAGERAAQRQRAGAVGDGDGLTSTQPQHAAEVVQRVGSSSVRRHRRRRRATWAADRRSVSFTMRPLLERRLDAREQPLVGRADRLAAELGELAEQVAPLRR